MLSITLIIDSPIISNTITGNTMTANTLADNHHAIRTTQSA
ncbi:hypothetical protein [Pectobacterium aroidearum]|nr:hypothetical protein [Pectobacterium aroidearum]